MNTTFRRQSPLKPLNLNQNIQKIRYTQSPYKVTNNARKRHQLDDFLFNDYQQLKMRYRQLENQNRNILAQCSLMIEQRSKILNELECRKHQIRIKNEKLYNLEQQINKWRTQFYQMESQLLEAQDLCVTTNSQLKIQRKLTQQLSIKTKNDEAENKQMSEQIRLLLNIQRQNQITIDHLKNELQRQQELQIQSNRRIKQLGNLILQLQKKLVLYQDKNHELQKENMRLNNINSENILLLTDKQDKIQRLYQQNNFLNSKIDEHIYIEDLKQKQLTQLIIENQRLYKQINILRHELNTIPLYR